MSPEQIYQHALNHTEFMGRMWLSISILTTIVIVLLLYSTVKEVDSGDETELLTRSIILIILVIFNVYSLYRSLPMLYTTEWITIEKMLEVLPKKIIEKWRG